MIFISKIKQDLNCKRISINESYLSSFCKINNICINPYIMSLLCSLILISALQTIMGVPKYIYLYIHIHSCTNINTKLTPVFFKSS